MKLLYLYIKNYKKFKDIHISFNNGKVNSLEKEIFGQMNITTLVGENGSGKTTIMSYISTIFRYLQRDQAKIPSDFILEYEFNGDKIILSKEEDNIYFTKNKNKKKLLLELNVKKGYIRKIKQQQIKQADIDYTEVKQYLPHEIIISYFDIDYPNGYTWNYKGDRLITLNSGNAYHAASSTGLGISLGILRFLVKYFNEEDEYFNNLINVLGLKFSNMICAYCTCTEGYRIEDEELILAIRKILSRSDVNNDDIILNEITTGKYFEKFFYENKNNPDPIHKHFDLHKYLKHRSYNGSILEILIENGYFFINNFYIKKDSQEYSMSEMSTGEKMILGRTFYILSNISENMIIIIEEPEVHLNYVWLKQLISLFIILFKDYNSHFIISSHSYHFINSLLPEQILLLEDKQIYHPEFNTLLCSDEELYYRLKQGRSKNYIENYLRDLIQEGNGKKLMLIFENLGESYNKLKLFKRLIELGEIHVENN